MNWRGVGGMFEIDATDETSVVVCRCGWRAGPELLPLLAREAGEEHLRAAHPEYAIRVRDAQSRRRLRARSES